MRKLFFKGQKLALLIMIMALVLSGCSISGSSQDQQNQRKVTEVLTGNQQTPTDISYSLERDNLIRRAYWVNGMREKAISLPSAVERPLGYIALFSDSGAIVGKFIVNGKVSSLNSFLTPDSEAYSSDITIRWIADVDGSYGENAEGIFFFTPDGKYIEWTGKYLYTDIPFEIDEPVIKFQN